MMTSELTTEERSQRWSELQKTWSDLKSKKIDEKTAHAKINELQKTLGLEVSDFTKPYTPKARYEGDTKRFFKPTGLTREQRKERVKEFLEDVVPIVDAFITKRLGDIQYTFQERIIALEALLKPLATVYNK